MLSAFLPRAVASMRVKVASRAFVVAPRVVFPALNFTIRSLATTATATKRTSTTAKSAPTRARRSTADGIVSPRKRKTRVAKKPKKKSPKKKKAKKVLTPKAKLPIVPPRHVSAYIVYASETLRGVTGFKREDFGSQIAKVAADWKALPNEEKQKYVELAAQRSKENKLKYEEWSRDISPETLRKINRSRLGKKQHRIRLPGHADRVKSLNPFIIFTMDQRALSETWEGAPEGRRDRQLWFLSKMGAKWRSMSPEEKAVYTDRSAKHNAAYHAQFSG